MLSVARVAYIPLKALAANVIAVYSRSRRKSRKPDSTTTVDPGVERLYLSRRPRSRPSSATHLKGRCVELVATFKLSSAANSSSIRLRSPAAARVKMFFAISVLLKGVLMVAGSDATVRSKMSPKRESSSGS